MQMTLQNRNKALLIFPLSLLLLLPAISPAQSLGEVARQYRKEREAREKRGEVPIKVFTNDDIAGTAEPASVVESAQKVPAAQAGKQVTETTGNEAATASSSSSTPAVASSQESTKSKEYWKSRFKAARAALTHAKEEQTLVKDELQLLQIKQARALDPDRSRELNSEIDAKTIELESRRAATEKAQAALNKIEKEFKESGASQGWMDSGKEQN